MISILLLLIERLPAYTSVRLFQSTGVEEVNAVKSVGEQ